MLASNMNGMSIAVLGSGSWGTALSVMLARNGHEVKLFGRDLEEIEAIQCRRENPKYLPGFAIPAEVQALPLEQATGSYDFWVVAVPSGSVRAVVERIGQQDPLIVIASKGLEAGSSKLLSEVVGEACSTAEVVALSGPNLAVELVRGVPTVAVSACGDEAIAERVALAFNSRTFRVYLSDDVIGVGLAGALKNVMAIAAGIGDGLGFGDNTKGALMARGLHEMTKLGVAMGARFETSFGIAGAGDLFATASSKLSRNYRVGFALGAGTTLESALAEIGQVAEGVATADAVLSLGRDYDVEIPIMETTQAVIRGRMKAAEGVARLMEKLPRREGLFHAVRASAAAYDAASSSSE